jgi:hypothetical protein
MLFHARLPRRLLSSPVTLRRVSPTTSHPQVRFPFQCLLGLISAPATAYRCSQAWPLGFGWLPLPGRLRLDASTSLRPLSSPPMPWLLLVLTSAHAFGHRFRCLLAPLAFLWMSSSPASLHPFSWSSPLLSFALPTVPFTVYRLQFTVLRYSSSLSYGE